MLAIENQKYWLGIQGFYGDFYNHATPSGFNNKTLFVCTYYNHFSPSGFYIINILRRPTLNRGNPSALSAPSAVY